MTAAANGALSLFQSSYILPGIQVVGVNLGGRTRGGAARLLQSEWQSRKVVLQAGAGFDSWTLPLERVGLRLDTDAILAQAHEQGRWLSTTDEVLATARQLIAANVVEWPAARDRLARVDPRLANVELIELSPAWTFDRDAAAQTLRTLAGQVEIIPQDAGVGVVDGRVEMTPAVIGRALDIGAALAELEARAAEVTENTATGAQISIPLTVRTIPPTVTDVSAVVEEVSPLLDNLITVYLWDPIGDERFTWTITPEVMGTWISFRPEPQNPSAINWSLDKVDAATYVREQNAALGDGRHVNQGEALSIILDAFQSRSSEVRLRVYHSDRTHTVQSGETLSSIAADYGLPYPWVLVANPELGDTLGIGDEVTIPSPDALLPLPPVENKRVKISISAQRMQAYENGQVKWDWPVSTGISSSPTSPGIFQVQSHEENAYAANWDLWMPYFMGIYRPVPGQDFMNGFHGFPSRDRKQILWQRNLGRPITYGCILLSTENAKLLYDWAQEGVIVEIAK